MARVLYILLYSLRFQGFLEVQTNLYYKSAHVLSAVLSSFSQVFMVFGFITLEITWKSGVHFLEGNRFTLLQRLKISLSLIYLSAMAIRFMCLVSNWIRKLFIQDRL